MCVSQTRKIGLSRSPAHINMLSAPRFSFNSLELHSHLTDVTSFIIFPSSKSDYKHISSCSCMYWYTDNPFWQVHCLMPVCIALVIWLNMCIKIDIFPHSLYSEMVFNVAKCTCDYLQMLFGSWNHFRSIYIIAITLWSPRVYVK